MKNFGETPIEHAEKKEGIPQEIIDHAFFFLVDPHTNELESRYDDLVREICQNKGLSGRLERTQIGYSLQPDDTQSNERGVIHIDAACDDIDQKTGEYWVDFDAHNRARSAISLIKETIKFKASAEAVATYAAQEAAKEEQWRKEYEKERRIRHEHLPPLVRFAHEHKNEIVNPNTLEEIRPHLEACFHWTLEPEDTVMFGWLEDEKTWRFSWNRGKQVRDIVEFQDIELT